MLFGKDQKSGMGVIQKLDRKKLLKGGEVLQLQPFKKLIVTVKDEQDKPLQNAEVSAYGESTASYGIKTDSKGQAAIDGLCCGSSCNLSVEKKGYQQYYVNLPKVDGIGWTGYADAVLKPVRKM